MPPPLGGEVTSYGPMRVPTVTLMVWVDGDFTEKPLAAEPSKKLGEWKDSTAGRTEAQDSLADAWAEREQQNPIKGVN